MTAIEICVGCILHWKGFTFADGGTVDKYLVIVGAHPAARYRERNMQLHEKVRRRE